MATYLLDTDIIIDALRGKRGRGELLMRLVGEGNALACCAVNVTEVYAGMRPEEEPRTRGFIEGLIWRPVTREVATRAGLMKRDWARRGITLAVTDVTVVAVALVNGLTLLTGNRRHYPMPELRIFPLPEE